MTLCIANKIGDEIQLLSDSRLSVPRGQPFDTGIKILSVPVVIYSAIQPGTANPQPVYSKQYGICLAGHAASALSIVGALSILLGRLQKSSEDPDVPMERINDVIKKYFESMSQQVCSSLSHNGQVEMMVVGYCGQQRRPRAFKFKLDCGNYPIQANVTEVLTGNNMEFIGSGSKAAKALFANNSRMPAFHIMREVIKDPSEPGVGGGIQYGLLKNEQFELRGVRNYCPDHLTKKLNIQYFLAGQVLYEQDFDNPLNGFLAMRHFADPFGEEISALLSAGYS